MSFNRRIIGGQELKIEIVADQRPMVEISAKTATKIARAAAYGINIINKHSLMNCMRRLYGSRA